MNWLPEGDAGLGVGWRAGHLEPFYFCFKYLLDGKTGLFFNFYLVTITVTGEIFPVIQSALSDYRFIAGGGHSGFFYFFSPG